VRLGEALIATGNATPRARSRPPGLDRVELRARPGIRHRAAHGDILTPDIDRERLDHLLWHNLLADARREISRVTAEAQRVGNARIALRTSPTTGERLLDNLPETLRDDPGVIFDQAHLLRQHGQVSEIPPLLVRAPTREMAKIAPRAGGGNSTSIRATRSTRAAITTPICLRPTPASSPAARNIPKRNSSRAGSRCAN
jgi:hypothetical protein